MDIIEMLGLSAGMGFLAGIRLYATVLAMGLAIRYHWITFGAGQEHWGVLAHPAVMITAGVLAAIELCADKIAWLDSVWDAFHTFIRPVGAVLLGAAAFSGLDPKYRVMLVLLCGGMALTTHVSKAATRVVVNHSPEPFSNMAISAAEDVIVPAGIWVMLTHPLVLLVLISIFIVGFVWMFRKVVRAIKRRFGWGVPRTAVAA